MQRHSVPEFRNHQPMETMGDRIRKLRERRGIEATDLARAIKLGYSTLKDLENNRSKSTTKLPALIRELRTNARYLETGKGDPDQTEAADPDWEDILGYAHGAGLGNGVEAQEYAETHKLKFRSDSLARKRLRSHELAVIYGKGESMLPRIHSGDAILFDQSSTEPKHKKLFVIAVPGVGQTEYNVKRCNIIGGMVFFDALNPEADHDWIEPRRMDDPRSPIQIIGRVRWIGSWED